MITITERAAAKVVEMAAEEKLALVLRMKVQGGGCAGFSYDLAFEDKEPEEMDEVFESNGIKLVVDPMSLQYLDNTDVDYVTDGLLGEGFKFNNPNVKDECGCGESFRI